MAYKVLVVEDDNFLVTAYKVKLTQEGFEVQVATDGEEAIKLLQGDYMPDIVLMDAVMPRKDGFTALQEIKAQAKFKDLPVIMASNLGQPGDVDKAMSLGAVDFITKSNMAIGDLSAKLKAIVEKK